MKVSTRGRYALRAMVDIALNYREEPVVLSDVARRQEISEQYLEHLARPLRVAGLVRSVRGARGGFVLARSPSTIKVSDIIRAVEGSTALVECVDSPLQCHRADSCPTRGIWVKATEAVDQVFGSITLEDLMSANMDMCCPTAADIKTH
ncbi:MAG: Rrf2 family transcriptional regulator [Chloroflexota bacterium]